MITAQKILVVAAHPDDEALGCGGTIARLTEQGSEVHLLFVADGVGARDATDHELANRHEMAERAAVVMGARPPQFLDFPDNRLDSVDLLDIVQAVEDCAHTVQPDLVLTHSQSDLNIDHRICSQAVLTAFRPMPGQSVRSILAFEVPSSTEWNFSPASVVFEPNMFVDISTYIETKFEALREYKVEMRTFPHARSMEAVEALARWRGATCGVTAAEAFTLLRAIS